MQGSVKAPRYTISNRRRPAQSNCARSPSPSLGMKSALASQPRWGGSPGVRRVSRYFSDPWHHVVTLVHYLAPRRCIACMCRRTTSVALKVNAFHLVLDVKRRKLCARGGDLRLRSCAATERHRQAAKQRDLVLSLETAHTKLPLQVGSCAAASKLQARLADPILAGDTASSSVSSSNGSNATTSAVRRAAVDRRWLRRTVDPARPRAQTGCDERHGCVPPHVLGRFQPLPPQPARFCCDAGGPAASKSSPSFRGPAADRPSSSASSRLLRQRR